jgi:uncharacterized iron-regulated protein
VSKPRSIGSTAILRSTLAGLLALFFTTVAARDCVPLGTWVVPSAQGPTRASARAVLMSASKRSVVLLGELHDRAEHHRWQLQTMAALHVLRENLMLGFEMFPRRVQSVLDRWVAGELSETEFLKQSDWAEVWGFESADYLPLFHFARLNRIPMLALNVERNLVREIGRKGVDAVPESLREGIGRPAAPPHTYVAELHAIYLEHPEAQAKESGLDDPAFLRFVNAQLTWDRAMAEAIRGALERHPGRQMVAVMGRGHTAAGAVPHQLRDLGVTDVAVLLPWENDMQCERLVVQLASAVFGVAAPQPGRQRGARPRLGVMLAAQDGGAVRIDRVVSGSIAESAGIRGGDVVLTAAGATVNTILDVQRAVSRQAPGTWLPLRVRRDGAEIDLIAKFPPE